MSYVEIFLKFWKPLFLSYLFAISIIFFHGKDLWFFIAALFAFLAVMQFAQNVHLSITAHKDLLTGLGNKNSLEALLKREVARVNRNGGYLVFLFIDIDNFKRINDTRGHKTGDAVLVEVAKRLVAQKRTYDELIRYGGDEFCIICSLVRNEEDALRIKHKLKEDLHFWYRDENGDFPVATSCGMAIYPTDTEDLQQLIAIADCRMYEQKEQRKLSRMADR